MDRPLFGSALMRGLVATATGGAIAVTLMACYGAPPCPADGCGSGGSGGSGGDTTAGTGGSTGSGTGGSTGSGTGGGGGMGGTGGTGG